MHFNKFIALRSQIYSRLNTSRFSTRCEHYHVIVNSSTKQSPFPWITVVSDQLETQLLYFIIRLLQSATCFEQRRAHHQEVKLY